MNWRHHLARAGKRHDWRFLAAVCLLGLVVLLAVRLY
jgi:hypothetical protein